jgi:hypothetical protein
MLRPATARATGSTSPHRRLRADLDAHAPAEHGIDTVSTAKLVPTGREPCPLTAAAQVDVFPARPSGWFPITATPTRKVTFGWSP